MNFCYFKGTYALFYLEKVLDVLHSMECTLPLSYKNTLPLSYKNKSKAKVDTSSIQADRIKFIRPLETNKSRDTVKMDLTNFYSHPLDLSMGMCRIDHPHRAEKLWAV
jgi:hypothetical protein